MTHTVFIHFPTAGQKNPVVSVCPYSRHTHLVTDRRHPFQMSYKTATRSSTLFSKQISVVIQRPFNLSYEFYTRDMKQILPTYALPPGASHSVHETPTTPSSAYAQGTDSSLLASRDLTASVGHNSLSSSPGSLMPPSLSLASSAELTSTIFVEDISNDEDEYVEFMASGGLASSLPPPTVFTRYFFFPLGMFRLHSQFRLELMSHFGCS